ncbi:MAG TPA: amidohydrolase family protein [Alphaproteobacteria bacterium]|nr:amidohydrolase family protein [Alphaproteobacteria bacterium]
MAEIADIVLRGGTIVDGRGGEPFEADVAVSHGKIHAVERSYSGRGAEEIDVKGLLVTPGFVDIHTHYDGQVTWEERLQPSSGHGVTTAVMGNCGIGFAPCRPEDHQGLIKLMEGVEDLPEPVLAAGLPWTWTSFPEYLEFLSDRRYDIDFGAQLPHAALRVFAMGQRGIDREPANEDDMRQMGSLAAEAMQAGALGFSTSRSLNHRASDGRPTPTLTASEDELTAIARAMGKVGQGVIEIASDFADIEHECAMWRRVVEASGRPLSVPVIQWHHAPDKAGKLLDWIDRCAADGLPVVAQVFGRPVGMLLGFELNFNPFSFCPSYRPLAALSPEQRLKSLKDPAVRAKIIAEKPVIGPDDPPAAERVRGFEAMFPLGNPPNYEPGPERMIDALARSRGVTPAEMAYDLLMEQEGRAVLASPVVNFVDGTLNASLSMLSRKNTVLGLGDGGAHLGFLCDASYPTTMLTHWARDRKGERLSVPRVIKRLTSETADAVGLHDRGRVAIGYKADLNVIDFANLTMESPRVAYDLPEGGRRVSQKAKGYVATIVSGQVTYRDGEPTRALPGRLVRGAKAMPAA